MRIDTGVARSVHLAGVAALAVLLSCGAAQAGTLTFDYTFAHTGTAPEGASPWLRATFSEGPAANEVRLRLDAVNLSRTEFVSTWLFNLDPRLDPEDLSIVWTGGLSPSDVRAGANDLNRGGARFDWLLDYPTRHGSSRFAQGDDSEFLISWSESGPAIPLTPESFAFTSSGRRALYTGAHVQGIGWCEDDSGWVTGDPSEQPVPEPGTLLLVGSGVLGLARLRRRRHRG